MQKWQTDMTKCPDCGKVFNPPISETLYHCNGNNGCCESVVYATRTGKLYWWNDNWE